MRLVASRKPESHNLPHKPESPLNRAAAPPPPPSTPQKTRYDDLATTSENIDLQSTILSRFDLIFIVRDAADPERDAQIAQ